MEQRSHRRTRDLVTLPASQGLSENENGCARISMMARSTNARFKGRIQKRKTNPLHHSHLACNTRPLHTEGHQRRFERPLGMSASLIGRSLVQRNSVPSIEMRCMITASRRARATMAFFMPRRPLGSSSPAAGGALPPGAVKTLRRRCGGQTRQGIPVCYKHRRAHQMTDSKLGSISGPATAKSLM